MFFIFIIILAYVVGSIPFGVVFSSILGFGDLRKIGSGNVGATNALRTGSKKLAILTLLGDILKATLVVFIGKYFVFSLVQLALVGISAVIGHIFSIFLKFRGGKGVATFLGFLLAYSGFLTVLFIASWLIVAKLSRYSSLSAIISIWVCTIASLVIFTNINIVLVFIAISIIITLRHKENIKRLISGTETKIGNAQNVAKK